MLHNNNNMFSGQNGKIQSTGSGFHGCILLITLIMFNFSRGRSELHFQTDTLRKASVKSVLEKYGYILVNHRVIKAIYLCVCLNTLEWVLTHHIMQH